MYSPRKPQDHALNLLSWNKPAGIGKSESLSSDPEKNIRDFKPWLGRYKRGAGKSRQTNGLPSSIQEL
jgi:hypothetical protein